MEPLKETRTMSGADPGGETAPELFTEAVEDPRWRESMQVEIKAPRNRGVWRVIQTPHGVRLIKSKYVYRIKKDWTGKVVKQKSILVVQGFFPSRGSRLRGDICASCKSDDISSHAGTIESPQAEDLPAGCGQCISICEPG